VRLAVGIGAAAGLLAFVAACGSSSTGGTPRATSTSPTGPDLAFPSGSATGRVISVANGGATVATSAGSADIAFSTATELSRVTAASRSSIVRGVCISALPTDATPSGSDVMAAVVTITSTSTCPPPSSPTQGNAPGGGYAQPDSGGTSSGPVSARRLGATGTVTSASRTSIVISPDGPSPTSPITVRTTTTTAYWSRADASRTDITVGACLSAFGDKPGAVIDATAATISDPVNGECENTLLLP
jgi:hypothetical protein